MNWGVKIFVVLAIFIVGMVAVGIYMVGKNTDSLVETDYYERGINFDQVYERRQNLETYQARPTISIQNDTLYIHFVHQGNEGQLNVNRPSDHSMDQLIPLSVADDIFRLPVWDLSRGSWDLLLEWEAMGQSFQYEQTIYLN